MKNILIIICLLAFGNLAQCQSGKSISQIELSKTTRGHQEFIRITPDSVNVYVESHHSTEKPVTKYGRKIEPAEWTELVKITQQLKLEDIPKLPSPTMKRAVDAAMHSTIIIQTSDGKSYEHGYDDEDPHKDLKPLRREIRKVSGRKE